MQQRLREISYLGWRNAWIEPAFWDIKGKLAGKPVCELIGGAPCTVNLYASTGDVKEPAKRIEELEARYAEGFRAAKLRVHDFDEAVDARHVTETARAMGDRMKLGVDANQAWRVTIVADAQLCRQHGLLYTPHTWTNGIGFAINLQLMAASGFAAEKELEYPINPPGWTVEGRDALLEEPFRHERGTLQVPSRPGLGFTIDKKALQKHGKRFFVMDRKRLMWFSLRTRGLSVSREIDRVRKQKRRAGASDVA